MSLSFSINLKTTTMSIYPLNTPKTALYFNIWKKRKKSQKKSPLFTSTKPVLLSITFIKKILFTETWNQKIFSLTKMEILSFATLDGVQNLVEIELLFAARWIIWVLKYSDTNNMINRLMCGLLAFYCMNCYMGMLLLAGKEQVEKKC